MGVGPTPSIAGNSRTGLDKNEGDATERAAMSKLPLMMSPVTHRPQSAATMGREGKGGDQIGRGSEIGMRAKDDRRSSLPKAQDTPLSSAAFTFGANTSSLRMNKADDSAAAMHHRSPVFMGPPSVESRNVPDKAMKAEAHVVDEICRDRKIAARKGTNLTFK